MKLHGFLVRISEHDMKGVVKRQGDRMFVVKGNEMKKIDSTMIDTLGMPSLVLMENAARNVVDLCCERFPIHEFWNRRITVLCGNGNNGGDGFVVARWLVHLGYNVTTVFVGTMDKMSSDCGKEYELLKTLLISRNLEGVFNYADMEERCFNEVLNSHIIIDGILGTGCSRTLSKELYDLVQVINKSNAYRIAIDIPTGINSDNGKVMGGAVVADVTVTFCLPKLGNILYPGADYSGELIVADIGIYEECLLTIDNPIQLLDKEVFLQLKQEGVFERSRDSHKGTFGTVGIIAGDKSMLGATIMVAKAAYRTGAGLVRIFASEDSVDLLISSISECVIVPYDPNGNRDVLDEQLEKFALASTVLTIGPGLSKSVHARHLVEKVMSLEHKVVFDADALNIISQNTEMLNERRCECIITPHIKEMSRLTGYCVEGIAENTLQFAEAFSQKHELVTILKSARTVITTPDGGKYILYLGNDGMATGGSGDVLVGVIAGFISMGYNIKEASLYGTMLHSLSADHYIEKNKTNRLMATDIIENLWL